MAEALEQGAQTLITGGALQSNHCRQTAAAAARFGLDCILVLNGEMPEHPSADRDQALQETYDKAVASGKKPYLVTYGGSSATGTLGYAFAMKELMEQLTDFRSLKDFGSL